MRFSKSQLIYFSIIVIITIFLATFQLEYYIYKPGKADPLNSVVSVEEGYDSEGSMHLLTVSGSQATPIQYIMAKFLPYHEILPLEEVRPKGVTDDEYMEMQLHMMENSQESSTVVAYEAADADIQIDYRGVYVVSVIDEMPAEGILETGDIITSIDEEKINESEELLAYMEHKEMGESITLEIERDETQLTETIELEELPGADKVGIGITLVTNRDVDVHPDVQFSSGQIGGPSAGLIFSLDIYDQLTETDLTKGNHIAATGEIDYEGNVGRIGGIDKKIVAADKEGCDVFFAPNEDGAKDSNYAVAKETADEINTDMEIVPVDTFEDALDYLDTMEED